MWKDTEYFKNKGGEFHTHWDKLRGVTLWLEAPVWHVFLFVLFLPVLPSLSPDLHRWAVFLLLQLGEDIQDTEMILVDRTLTDISFQNSLLL